jgi:hypothetical protein
MLPQSHIFMAVQDKVHTRYLRDFPCPFPDPENALRAGYHQAPDSLRVSNDAEN